LITKKDTAYRPLLYQRSTKFTLRCSAPTTLSHILTNVVGALHLYSRRINLWYKCGRSYCSFFIQKRFRFIGTSCGMLLGFQPITHHQQIFYKIG